MTKLPKLVNSLSLASLRLRSGFIVYRDKKSTNYPTTQLPNYKLNGGFTLIELLVVIGILTILLAIVLIAINPARQFAQANNTQRRSDVNAILNAVHQYGADHAGTLPSGIPVTPASAAVIGSNAGEVDLCDIAGVDELVPTYLADLPLDPTIGTTDATGAKTCSDLLAAEDYSTGYTIVRNASNRLTVTATAEAEGATTPTIRVTR